MGGLGVAVPAADVMRALQDRNLVFELMTHPDQLLSAAEDLTSFDDLTVVVEHTGWPRNDSDEERALWNEGMRALAALGPNVVCKLSGLAMPLGSLRAEALRPWLEPTIEAFGADRCMFASNFPVDSAAGSFDELYTTFDTITSGLDAASRDALFAGTAERIYRL
jgi:predicted TIM-barrel fold metal-dependent hydrolase